MSPRFPTTVALLGALVSIPLAGAGCKRPVGEIVGMGDALTPFERPPYLQDVDTTSALVRWQTVPGGADRADLRLVGGPWRDVPVDVWPDTLVGVSGPVVTRTARLSGLAPGTSVQYRILSGSRTMGPYTFRTAPHAVASDTVRLLAFGDSGWGSAAQFRLAELMLSERLDLAVHTGDIAYQVGSEGDFTLRHFQVYAELIARIPFFPSPGNHDLRSEGGAPYDRAFAWDAPYEGARFHSFRWGDVFFVALDTTDEDVPEPEDDPFAVPIADEDEDDERESDGAMLRDREGRQFEWLARELETARADPTVRWMVAFMHHPPYSHAEGFSAHGSDIRLERAISPLFDRYGVDLVLSGHDHHYERTAPILDQRPQPMGCGPVYIVTGGGGASRLARGIAEGPLLEAASREHHYVRLTIADRSIRGETVGSLGQTLDSFQILPFDGVDEEGDPLDPSCDD